ncbi:MAG: metalloregulator ArsR/SmtB family transcription factor [Dehalococcoidia bacterium]
MDQTLLALSEPRRRRILELVRDGELSAGEIAARFEVTRPAISQHLRVLKDAGLIVERRAGTRRFYRLRPEGMTDVRAYLDTFWASGLQRLKLQAELDERTRQSEREGRLPQ